MVTRRNHTRRNYHGSGHGYKGTLCIARPLELLTPLGQDILNGILDDEKVVDLLFVDFCSGPNKK